MNISSITTFSVAHRRSSAQEFAGSLTINSVRVPSGGLNGVRVPSGGLNGVRVPSGGL